MPKYRFICNPCKFEVERFVSPKTEESICPNCNASMARQFPSSGSQKTTETVDTFTNVRHEPEHKQNVLARKTEHFWEVEVPRLIQTYGIQTCLEEKWLIYNDKGELVVNKPPSKR